MLRRDIVAGLGLIATAAFGALTAAAQVNDNWTIDGRRIWIVTEPSVYSYSSKQVPGGLSIRFDGHAVEISNGRITVNSHPQETAPFDEVELLLKHSGDVVVRVLKEKK